MIELIVGIFELLFHVLFFVLRISIECVYFSVLTLLGKRTEYLERKNKEFASEENARSKTNGSTKSDSPRRAILKATENPIMAFAITASIFFIGYVFVAMQINKYSANTTKPQALSNQDPQQFAKEHSNATLEIELKKVDGKSKLVVVSPGSDKELGTDDDITTDTSKLLDKVDAAKGLFKKLKSAVTKPDDNSDED